MSKNKCNHDYTKGKVIDFGGYKYQVYDCSHCGHSKFKRISREEE